MVDYTEKLSSCHDFASIFGLVKKSVEENLGLRRVGLLLGLSNLPGPIGAYHAVGSNFIVLNRIPLQEVIKSSGDMELVNAYVFEILLHEYLHTLGYIDEEEVRQLTRKVCRSTFGGKHPATRMATNGPIFIFPSLRQVQHINPGREAASRIEIVPDFERDNTSYFA